MSVLLGSENVLIHYCFGMDKSKQAKNRLLFEHPKTIITQSENLLQNGNTGRTNSDVATTST